MTNKDDGVSTPDCSLADRDSRIVGYVAETLSADEADAFEAHYFACDLCWREVQQGLEIRAAAEIAHEAPAIIHPVVVAPPGTQPWRWVPLAAAAGVILAVGLTMWLREPSAPTHETTVASAPERPLAVPAATPTPPPPAPGSGKLPTSKPVVALAVLARFDAPVYLPVTLRGAHDEAVERFEAGMLRYVAKDFADAIPDLRAATTLNPKAPQSAFFLAICQLLTDQPEAAVAELQKTIGLGESAYLEEAHFYLAKARLGQGRLTEARDELTRAIAKRGRLEREARELLIEVNKHIEGQGR